ncbi:MAG: exo-alpha-sialidase, partial [Chloroflexi bacterium]|nr:exo-alpha-sialidase [Chloroflexota bacterium]
APAQVYFGVSPCHAYAEGGRRVPRLGAPLVGTHKKARRARKWNHGNPCPIVDRDTGTVWVFWVANEVGPDGKLIGKGVQHCSSNDDGLTWSEIEPFTLDGNPVWGPPIPSRGIQLSTGRLLLPLTVSHSVEKRNVPRIVYSDDHGKTWQFGKEPASVGAWKYVGSCEYTLLELADGRVYMNHRNNMHQQRHRVVSFSGDGGVTWSDPQAATDLVQPKGNGCHSGLIRLSHPEHDDKSRVLFSAPWGEGDFGRENLTIHISYDECKTWQRLKLIQSGQTSYSNLIVMPDKSIGCIYEFNDLSQKIWTRIMFSRFTLEWLTDGKDKVVAKGK